MGAPKTSITDETRLVIANIGDRTKGVVTPSIRLGVTGLARAGKTVFIAALVHNLIHGGRLPLFKSYAQGRVSGARLAPQPDDNVPRFDYEGHIKALVDDRLWPDSTDRISELRLTVNYESAKFFTRLIGSGKLHLDIVDYPGEWLLDLPLLSKDYVTWSKEAIAAAEIPARKRHAEPFLSRLDGRPAGEDDELTARELAKLYTAYLNACRRDTTVLSTQPPGRFVMPGDLDQSPALTFAPLRLAEAGDAKTPLAKMMARRFEAYKANVVRPFFRDHFARLDRQIVLVDALAALNAGPAAVADLEAALAAILSSFRLGRTNWLTSLVSRKIDRILFAATKADHLHHRDHDRLEEILRRIVKHATEAAHFANARVDVIALASVRATREASVTRHGETLPAIIGTPIPGEEVGGTIFDGTSETAIFPGDLPEDTNAVFETDNAVDVRFVRFRPPRLERTAEGLTLSLPHIRLDRALEFLFGDRLR